MNFQIIPLKLRISNAYLVLGDRPVLVDTGAPGDTDKILQALRKYGLEPSDLAADQRLKITFRGNTSEILRAKVLKDRNS